MNPTKTQEVQGIDYEHEPYKLHYAIIKTLKDSLEQRKVSISRYNSEREITDLKLNAFPFLDKQSQQTSIIAIISFKNFKKAKKYASKVRNAKLLPEREKIYPISQDNYRRLLEKQDFDEFEKFFRNQSP